MNPSPFTVSPNTHVSQVFNLFRTMGLRHLPVVNAVGEVSPSSTGGWGPRRPAQHRPRWSMHPPSGPPAAARESGLRSPRTRHSPSGGSLRRTPCSCPTGARGAGGRVGLGVASGTLPGASCGSRVPSPAWPAGVASATAAFVPASQTRLGSVLSHVSSPLTQQHLPGEGGSPSVHNIKRENFKQHTTQ